jgi:hypothetical protein
VALLALFIALSGTAHAATAARNSVASKSIRTGAVQSSDIKDNGVKGVDVDEASLGLGSVPSLAGPQGPVGPTCATAFSNPQDPVPPETPDVFTLNGQYAHQFFTPTSGRLLVFASLRHLAINCSAGNGNAFLFLDSVGVPGSGQVQPNVNPTDPFTPIALTDVVPAGEHRLSIAPDCPLGDHNGDSSSADGDLRAVLVGG